MTIIKLVYRPVLRLLTRTLILVSEQLHYRKRHPSFRAGWLPDTHSAANMVRIVGAFTTRCEAGFPWFTSDLLQANA